MIYKSKKVKNQSMNIMFKHTSYNKTNEIDKKNEQSTEPINELYMRYLSFH